jgi:hypothetical protein
MAALCYATESNWAGDAWNCKTQFRFRHCRLMRGLCTATTRHDNCVKNFAENAHLPRVNSAFSQIFALFSYRSWHRAKVSMSLS